jgi:hypothetical protein
MVETSITIFRPSRIRRKCPMGAGIERVSPPTPTDAHIFYWSK